MKPLQKPSYIRCVVCKRDPEPGPGKPYGRYGNRCMVCKYCRKRVHTQLEKARGFKELV